VTFLHRVLHEPAPPLPETSDKDLADVIEVSLRKDPGTRFVDGRALLGALEATVTTIPAVSTPPVLPPATPSLPAPVDVALGPRQRRAPLPGVGVPAAPEPSQASPGRPRPRLLAKGITLLVLLCALGALMTFLARTSEKGEGFGDKVALEQFGGSPLPAADASAAVFPTVAPSSIVFYRLLGDLNSCVNVRVDAATTSRALACLRRGTLLVGTGERREADGRAWLAVKEPRTSSSGWVPEDLTERA